MAKKPRTQRKRNGNKGQDNGEDTGGPSAIVFDNADYLSESHTIATLNSLGGADSNNSNGGGSFGMDDDMDDMGGGGDEAAAEAAEQRHIKLVDFLSTVPEYLGEKRSAKREQYLKLWFKGLTQYATMPPYDVVWQRKEDLLQACRFGIRQGTPSEQYAACRVLEVAAILLQEGDGQDWYEQVQSYLTRIINGSHRAVPVRVAALRALGLAVFIGIDDDQVTEQVLDLCEALAQTVYRGNPVPSTLRAAALEVWSLLATTIHELYVAGKDDVSTGRGLLLLPLLLECLEQSEDLTLRDSAGECVAWIHSARLELGITPETAHSHNTTTTHPVDGSPKLDTNNQSPSPVDDKTTEISTTLVVEQQSPDQPPEVMVNTTQRQYQQGSWEGSEWEDIMSEIEQVMEGLSNQSGHYMSKKAKKEQRANFRDYLATVQDNEPPSVQVQFRGGSLELNSWKDILPLKFIRRCLQSGFQVQILTNPTLQLIFGANGNALRTNSTMSQIEKRMLLSKTSEAYKLKDLDRHKKRDKRLNVKNHFLTVDGEDI